MIVLNPPAVLQTLLIAALGAVIGGMVGAAIALRAAIPAIGTITRAVQLELSVTPEIHRADIRAPVAVTLDVQVPPLDPIMVPIVTGPLPTLQESGDRILTIYPDTGPTDLAEMIGCSKSTAWEIIRRHQEATPAMTLSEYHAPGAQP